ncbi:signal peptidase I [Luteipulveratus flavus]|uniref:signal peptidase I n=1 Tax=Luteipulveratus flavus TaxID=3031728 RepID=UPI0038FD2E51
MTEHAAPQRASDDGVDSPEPTPSSRVRRRWPLWVLAFLALVTLTRGLLVETFSVPSGSMQPTLSAGDRIVVWKPAADEVRRGDVIVFDGTGTFGPRRGASEPGGLAAVVRSVGDAFGFRSGQSDYVKRVIGVGGDRVRMDERGRVFVNGLALSEPYADTRAAGPAFDIQVPPGRLWVMGDHRGDSDDSRGHLGDPGGGTVRVDDVVGTVVGRYWPLNELGGVSSAAPREDPGADR